MDINTKDYTNEFDTADISNNKVFAIFAYIGILVLVPIFGASNSRYAKFHANQGLMLFICEIVWGAIDGMLYFILKLFGIYFISVIFRLVNLVFLAALIYGIVNVAQGRAVTLPVIGKVKLIKWDK